MVLCTYRIHAVRDGPVLAGHISLPSGAEPGRSERSHQDVRQKGKRLENWVNGIDGWFSVQQEKEAALKVIDDVATLNLKLLCVSTSFQSVDVEVQTTRYDNTRQKVDMAALLLQELGANHHNRGTNQLAYWEPWPGNKSHGSIKT